MSPLNVRFRDLVPPGYGDVLTLSASADGGQEESEKKLFVCLSVEMTSAAMLSLRNFGPNPQERAFLDAFVAELSPDLVVDREEWEFMAVEPMRLIERPRPT